MNRELARVLPLLHDVRDHLHIASARILATSAGLAPLAEVARLKVGFEEDLGRTNGAE